MIIKKCGIYKVTSPTGRIYIGQSVDIFSRWKNYKYTKAQGQAFIRSSILKYGYDAHVFEIIAECDVEELDYYESLYIKQLDTYNTRHGMNLTMGGGGHRGFVPSIKTRELLSLRSSGENNGFYGRTHTKETMDIVIKANLGKKHKPETIAKMKELHNSPESKKRSREAQLGRKHSAESIQKIKNYYNNPDVIEKIRSAHLGKKHSANTIQKIVSARGWYKHSDETKIKISKSNFGKKRDDQHREKISNIILNTATGIFYYGIQSAADSIGVKYCALKMRIRRKNTPFIYT